GIDGEFIISSEIHDITHMLKQNFDIKSSDINNELIDIIHGSLERRIERRHDVEFCIHDKLLFKNISKFYESEYLRIVKLKPYIRMRCLNMIPSISIKMLKILETVENHRVNFILIYRCMIHVLSNIHLNGMISFN